MDDGFANSFVKCIHERQELGPRNGTGQCLSRYLLAGYGTQFQGLFSKLKIKIRHQ
jgi:hypothetical protein